MVLQGVRRQSIDHHLASLPPGSVDGLEPRRAEGSGGLIEPLLRASSVASSGVGIPSEFLDEVRVEWRGELLTKGRVIARHEVGIVSRDEQPNRPRRESPPEFGVAFEE